MLKRIPFNSDELKSTSTYPPARIGAVGAKKYNTPITPRENYNAVYTKGDMPLWIPISSDRRMWAPRLDADNVARGMVMDATPLTQEEMEKLARDGAKDKFGIDWVYVPITTGSIVRPGSPAMTDANDWEKIVQFPNVESWDWAGSKEVNRETLATEERLLYAWVQTGLFERLISFMDFEGAAMAIIDDDQKDAVKALMNRLADVYIAMIKKYKETYNTQVFCLHDDWGHQRNPFFSLNTVMEMIVPALTRVVQAVHDAGMFFDMHSCGKNELLVPAYLAAGCDSWSGQPMNDKAMLHEKYGDKLILGIEADITFTPETPEADAVAAAKRWVAKYGPTYEKKPCLCSAGAAPPAFHETLYEETRKMFG